MEKSIIEIAKQYYPEKDFNQFGQLIQYHYHHNANRTLYGVVLKVYSKYCLIFCLNWQDDSTLERPFWTDHFVGDFVDCSTGEVLSPRAFYEKYVSLYHPDRKFGYHLAGHLKSSPQICFTGFKKARRDELETMAKSADLWVTESAREHIEYLVCGSNAGPAKIAKAKELGAAIWTEQEFLEWIQTA